MIWAIFGKQAFGFRSSPPPPPRHARSTILHNSHRTDIDPPQPLPLHDRDQAAPHSSGPQALCIDRKVGTAVGGTGQSFDWSILKGFDAPVPLFLAGGIDEGNVAQAAEVPGISALDVSSGLGLRAGPLFVRT